MKVAASILLCALFVACSDAPVEENESTVSGESLYASQQCKMCHGPTGEGMPAMGPDLRPMDTLWSVDDLIAYLGDPKGYAEKDERLSKNLGKYRMPMPQNNLSEERRRILAEYVLAFE